MRLNRRSNDTHVLGLEHRVKAACELAIAIANQKPNRLLPLKESPRDLPRLLRDPGFVRFRRADRGYHPSAGQGQEEQHVQTLEQEMVSTVRKSVAIRCCGLWRYQNRNSAGCPLRRSFQCAGAGGTSCASTYFT